ncbi:MAG TPA: hypothetical protein VL463_14980 [Kofleriaceae bacterium]|jgi:hypothetical protein|nr:hypothetical protein [Kofleriaceae bacterium]
MRWALIAILIGACATNGGDDRPQLNGGGGVGGTTPGGSGGGGGGGGGDASTIVSGRVCAVTDLRNTTACASTVAGVAVTSFASGATTTTDQNGAFTIETGSVGGSILQVGTGSETNVPTIVRVDVPGAQVTIPVVNANDLTDLELGLGTVVPDGMGLVALHLVDSNGAGATGFTVTPPPGTTGGPFFDDQSALGFANGGTTGPAGTALLFGVPSGNFDIAFGDATTQGTFAGVPVFPGAFTFVNSTIGTP